MIKIVEYTPQLFTFDVVTQLIILISIIIMYIKTRELYSLSLQKGIKYLNNAMLFYFIGFSARLITTLLDFFSDGVYRSFEATVYGLGLVYINIYTSLLGGFFLAYCLVWRLFEKEQFKGKNLHVIVLYVFALAMVTIDMYLMIMYNAKIPYLFYISAIGALLFAIISNTVRCCKLHKQTKGLNPFLSLVGLGLGVYIATLIENLLYNFLFTIHYYAAGIYVVFSLAFLYNVLKLSK